eukprot:scaffold1521_cov92-Skeletonema_dohrnii-CCMP3373.AAC.2
MSLASSSSGFFSLDVDVIYLRKRFTGEQSAKKIDDVVFYMVRLLIRTLKIGTDAKYSEMVSKRYESI